MTAHELARKLLEGPDVPVVHAVEDGYGWEERPDEVSSAEQITVWRFHLVGEHWSDWSFGEPVGRTVTASKDKQSRQVVKLA